MLHGEHGIRDIHKTDKYDIRLMVVDKRLISVLTKVEGAAGSGTRGNTSKQPTGGIHSYEKSKAKIEITKLTESRNEIRMRTQRSLCGNDMMVVDKRLADSSREATRPFNKGT